MEIKLLLYGSSKQLSKKQKILIRLPKNSNIKKLRSLLKQLILKKRKSNDLVNLHKTAAFFSKKNKIINDNYKLKNKESISIIPPIGGG